MSKDKAGEMQLQSDMLNAVKKLLNEYAREQEAKHGAPLTTIGGDTIATRAAVLREKLDKDVFDDLKGPKENAIRLWTASKTQGHCLQLTSSSPFKPELCTILNNVISDDTHGELVADAAAASAARPALKHAATFAAMANFFLGGLRGSALADWENLPWHPIGVPSPYAEWKSAPGQQPSYMSYRGTSIPETSLTGPNAIFAPRTTYRAAMFLASSFNRRVAAGFAGSADTAAIPGICGLRKRVLFIVECPPTGCMHANYIDGNKGLSMMGASESELLFTPYSAFTVKAVVPPTTASGYYEITLEAWGENDESKPGGAKEDVRVVTFH